ncbi:MAG: 50S ribosomal protein L6 [Dehalococcoidia bacterium]|jgi:large subunit ribosomal protein L6
MSRVGRQPIIIPDKVKVEIDGSHVTVRGPGGELSRDVPSEMTLSLEGGQLLVGRSSDAPRQRALHGLTRSLIANMVIGVDSGFSKMLELHGVGYRGEMRGQNLVLSLGYSHPVDVPPPAGITLQMEGTSRVVVRGADKEMVGQAAADIRALRPPEPYKGKGIRYAGEHVRRKAGKAGRAVKT